MNGLTARLVWTAFTSGVVYALVFILLWPVEPSGMMSAIAFSTGILVYAVLRRLYKRDSEVDVLTAQAYRLMIWVVPLIILLAKVIILVTMASKRPEYSSFVTLEQLKWASVFALPLWLFINLFILVHNIYVFFLIMIFYFGIPVLISTTLVVLVALFFLFRRLIALKQRQQVDFSLVNATLGAVVPILLFSGIIYYLALPLAK